MKSIQGTQGNKMIQYCHMATSASRKPASHGLPPAVVGIPWGPVDGIRPKPDGPATDLPEPQGPGECAQLHQDNPGPGKATHPNTWALHK